MGPVDVESTLEWIRDSDMAALDEKWVPGASLIERQNLAALGGVAGLLLGDRLDQTFPAEIARWIADALPVPEHVARPLLATLGLTPDEALAALYARIVRNSHRRVLGTFFTPPDEVALMLEMWDATQEPPAAVIDVGAGVGVFTAMAADRWPSAKVHAVDVNPVTLGLLAARLSCMRDDERTEPRAERYANVSLVLEDFTSWLPATWDSLPAGRLILGNPPYTRAQLLSVEDRARLAAVAGTLCGSRASLSTIITALSLLAIGPLDGLCLLLPSHWLESDYARNLRAHLAKLSKRRVELRLVASGMFADAQVDAVALLVGSEQPEDQPLAFADWRATTLTDVDRHHAASTTWRRYFPSSGSKRRSVSADRSRASQSAEARLEEFCSVRRGVATGANAFFLLTDDQCDELGLAGEHLTPVIRRIAPLPNVVSRRIFDRNLAGERRWLLTVTKSDLRSDPAVADYIADGEASGVDSGELCRRRDDWYDLAHDLVTPDVIIGAMTRGTFRFIENSMGAAITNNLYGWRWLEGTRPKVRKRVLAWLRSEAGQQAVTGAARRQADGLVKIEPRALRSVVIPKSALA